MTTRVDNIQRLADVYAGYDRNANTNQFDFGKIGSEAVSTAVMVGAPMLIGSAAAPYVRPYWDGLMKWKNDPLCGSYSDGISKARLEASVLKEQTNFLRQNAAGEKYGFWQRYKNKAAYKHMQGIEDQMGKLTAKGVTHPEIKNMNTLLEEAKNEIKNTGKLSKETLGKITKSLQKTDIHINKLKAANQLKAGSKLGRAAQAVGRKTGYYKAKGFVMKGAKGYKFLKAAGKFGKGAAGFAAVGAVLSQAGDVMGAKQIDDYERSQGRKSNRMKKQIGKSAVVVGATVAGSWLAAAGAGAAIGTAAGPIGTVVGFVAGAIGGLIGGWLGKKAVGKSEVEKYQEQQAKEQAKLARENNTEKDQMLDELWQAKEKGQLIDKELIAILEEEIAIRKTEIEEVDATSNQMLNMGNIRSYVA